MLTLLFSIMIIFWLLFIISILLMAPKGGLGFGIGGMSTSNEYGSKKSIEWTLKKTAIISIVLFTIAAILYPYANRKVNKTTTNKIYPTQNQIIKNNDLNKKVPSALVSPKTDKNK